VDIQSRILIAKKMPFSRKNDICYKREKPMENSVKYRKSIRISGKLGINI
jgi:hypothetical protein